MIYKDYQSFRVKNGVVDVFVIDYDDRQSVQIFISDHLSHSTSSATFSTEDFEAFVEFMGVINDNLYS